MIFNVILFGILILCGFCETTLPSNGLLCDDKTRAKRFNYLAVLPVISVLFLGVFRETNVGYDSYNYYYYYWSSINDFSWFEIFTNFTIDNGFYFVLKVISLFTDSWWATRAVLFILTFGLYYASIRKFSPYPVISLIVFFGLGHLGLMYGILRQVLAGAICLSAYGFLKKGSWGKALVVIAVAMTFHKSAVLCLYFFVIRFFMRKRFSAKKIIVLSVLAYAVFFGVIPVVTYLYAGSRYVGIAGREGGYGMLLFYVVVIVLTRMMIKEADAETDEEAGILYNFSCGALFLQLGALQWSLLNRATSFFSVYWCFLISNLLCKMPQKKRWLYFAAVVMLFGFMFFYRTADVEKFVMHVF